MDKEGIEFLKKKIVDLDELMEEGADGKNSVIHLVKPKEFPEGYAGIGAGAIFSRKELQTGHFPEDKLEKLLKEPALGFYYDGEFVPFSPLANNL